MSEIDILGLDDCLEPLYVLLKDSSGFFVLFFTFWKFFACCVLESFTQQTVEPVIVQ